MPIVPPTHIHTKEVLEWTGVHLLAFSHSLCSRKVAVILALKGVKYERHDMDSTKLRTPYFLGINPRGLVPVLVHDGTVIIESNDILAHLLASFPSPQLVPEDPGEAQQVQAILDMQDEYHLDIRALTFSNRFAPEALRKMAAAKVAAMDSETVVDIEEAGGQGRAVQRAWQASVAENGIPPEQVEQSVAVFRQKLKPLDATYGERLFLVGDGITLADVAIWVDVERLLNVAPPGFDVRSEFPNLFAAFERLRSTLGEHFDAFAKM